MKAESTTVTVSGIAAFEGPLKAGSAVLGGRFKVTEVLANDAESITYSGKDSRGASVTILEFFPSGSATRGKDGVAVTRAADKEEFDRKLQAFVEAGKKLLALKHPGIASVRAVETSDGAAYIVSNMPAGQRLSDFLRENGPKIRPPAISAALEALLKALDHVHSAGILHRNISPSAIFVDADQNVMLTDFHVGSDLRKGGPAWAPDSAYVPPELLGGSAEPSQGSDLYSLAATFYHVIVRRPPADAKVRLAATKDGKPDPYWPLWKPAIAYRPGFRMGIDLAMCVDTGVRLQSVEQWKHTIAEVHSTDAHPVDVGASKGDDSASKLIEAIVAESQGPETQSPSTQVPATDSSTLPHPSSAGAKRIVPAGPSPRADAAAAAKLLAAAAKPTQSKASSGSTTGLISGGSVAALVLVGLGFVMLRDGSNDARPLVEDGQTAAVDAAISTTATAVAPAIDPALAERLRTPRAEVTDVKSASSTAEGEAALPSPEPSPEKTAEAAPEPAPEVVAAVESAEVRLPEPTVDANSATTPIVVTPQLAVRLATPFVVPEEPKAAESAVVAPEVPAAVPEAEVADPEEVAVVQVEPVVAPAEPESASEPAGTNVSAAGTSPAVISALSVDLGFQPAPGEGVVIGTVDDNATPWMQPGQRIVLANGVLVGNTRDLMKAIRESSELKMGGAARVTFGVQASDGAPVAQQEAELPVVQDVALLNGLRFKTRFVDGREISEVTVVPEGLKSGLQVGDVLLGYVPTQEKIGVDIGLTDLLIRELGKGATTFPIAAVRGGKTWVVGFDYAPGGN